MGDVSDYADPPGDLDGVLADLLHGAVAAHVKQIGLEVLSAGARLSSHQEQRTSEVRDIFDELVFLITQFCLKLVLNIQYLHLTHKNTDYYN